MSGYQFWKMDMIWFLYRAAGMNNVMIRSRTCSCAKIRPLMLWSTRKADHDAHSFMQCLSTRTDSTSLSYIPSRRTLRCSAICLFNSLQTNYRPVNWVNSYTVVAQSQALLVTEKLFASLFYFVIGIVFLKQSNRSTSFSFSLKNFI